MTPEQRARALILCGAHPLRPELLTTPTGFHALVDRDEGLVLHGDSAEPLLFTQAEGLIAALEAAVLRAGGELPPDPPVCSCGQPAVCCGAENGDPAQYFCADCGGLDHNDWGQTREEILAGIEPGTIYPGECGWLMVLSNAVERAAKTDGPGPCADCGTERRDRSACPLCGKIVCLSCAENPNGYCCDGERAAGGAS